MEDKMNYILLALTLLNLGLVLMALSRLNGLRRDLRTPVVKKFNQDFKRKPVDIPKNSDNSKKDFRPQNRNNQQPAAQGRPNNQQQQNRPAQQKQIRRPAAKAPDVFSNDVPDMQAAATPVPPRPVASEPSNSEGGRRPLPPRFATTEPADLAPLPAPSIPVSVANVEDEDSGMELDRSKMTHGRRNMVKKSMIDDDDNTTEEKTA